MCLQKAGQETHFKSQKTKYKQMVKHTNTRFSADELTDLQTEQKHQVLPDHLWVRKLIPILVAQFGNSHGNLKNMCNL